MTAQTVLTLLLAVALAMVICPLLWQAVRHRGRVRHSVAYACCTCLLLLSACSGGAS